MQKIKVLPLRPWMTSDKDAAACAPQIIKPRMYREGWFKDTCQCWFEHNGTARLYSGDTFSYYLRFFNHRPLRDIEQSALRTLILAKLASPAQKNLLALDIEWKMLTKANRQVFAVRRRFDQWLNKHNESRKD